MSSTGSECGVLGLVRKLRVVVLTAHSPYPTISGGRRREYELIRRLGSMVDIHLVAVSKTYADDRLHAEHLAACCASVTILPAEDASAVAAETAYGGPGCVAMDRHRQRDAQGVIADLRPDLVHVEGFYLLQHVPPGIPTLLIEHNVEYELLRQIGDVDGAARTFAAECEAWSKASLVAAVTRDDSKAIQQTTGSWVPVSFNGMETTGCSDALLAAAPQMLFPANFGYWPNVDAATWLLREVMPPVWERRPDCKLALVGNQAELLSEHASDSVTVVGRVPSLSRYYATAWAVVCPLRVGGGIKQKVLEALGHGRPVVGTTIACQGLEWGVSTGAILRADDAIGLAAQIVRVLYDDQLRRRMREQARDLARQLPTWDASAMRVYKLYRWVVPRPALGSSPGLRSNLLGCPSAS